MVGSSRLAGVAVLDLERRVDLPKAPVSGTARRFRTLLGLPSCLDGGQHMGIYEKKRQGCDEAEAETKDAYCGYIMA